MRGKNQVSKGGLTPEKFTKSLSGRVRTLENP